MLTTLGTKRVLKSDEYYLPCYLYRSLILFSYLFHRYSATRFLQYQVHTLIQSQSWEDLSLCIPSSQQKTLVQTETKTIGLSKSNTISSETYKSRNILLYQEIIINGREREMLSPALGICEFHQSYF